MNGIREELKFVDLVTGKPLASILENTSKESQVTSITNKPRNQKTKEKSETLQNLNRGHLVLWGKKNHGL